MLKNGSVDDRSQKCCWFKNNDAEVRKLWQTMNSWVYDGFDITYKQLGVDFDKIYYESNTYLTGKSEVERGLERERLLSTS